MEEQKTLTKKHVDERLFECWDVLRFDKKLNRREKELLDYNLYLIKYYIELNMPRETEHTFVCGFELDEDDEEEQRE